MALEQQILIAGIGFIGLLAGFLVTYFIMSARHKTAESEQIVLTTTLNILQNEQAKLAESKTQLVSHAEYLAAELSTTKETLSSIRAELAAEQHKNQALKEHVEQLQGSAVTAQSHLAEAKANYAAIDKHAKGLEVTVTETEKNYQLVKQELANLHGKFDELQQRYTQKMADYAELKTSLDERDLSHKERLAQLEENKQALTKEFENLANKIFEEKGKTFTDTSRSSIDILLKPFREQIEGFQKRINDVHDASQQGNTQLNAEIRKVLDIGLKMSDEATNLTSALKGNSQQRGAWGEVQLQRTLEMSGLVEDDHFEKQSSFKDADGKQKQTDYLIKLPGDKHIIIDSKVSLVAYDKTISAQTDEEYTLALTAHVRAIKSHIDDLASKDYTNLIGMRSPSFVLMFMPIEPAYIEALKHNKDLFGYGYSKNIVLVSHTTLIPILRTVSNLWVMEQSNKEAREISDRAGDIYNSVCIVAERLQKLGNTLNTASNHYNDTVKALVGQQGLHGKVDRFTQLSSKVSKSLPAIDVKHMEFETERLTLIAEPLHEESLLPLNELVDENK